jgi:hypothetical protein
VVRSDRLLLSTGASGFLTCATEGIAFWTNDDLSFRWPYEQVESIGIGSSATQTGGALTRTGFGLGTVVAPQFADLLNKVTTQTVAHSLINLVMRESAVVFLTASISQRELELDMAFVLGPFPARG